MVKFLVSSAHLSFPGDPSSRNYITTKLHLNHCKVSPCIFNFSFFRLIILLLSEFFMEDQHGGSSRILFILQLFFKIFSKLRSVKLYSKINMVLNTCVVFRSSSILHLAIRSAILSTIFRRWYYVILDNLSSCFMIHMLLRMSYF